jgi:hypothetical protein
MMLRMLCCYSILNFSLSIADTHLYSLSPVSVSTVYVHIWSYPHYAAWSCVVISCVCSKHDLSQVEVILVLIDTGVLLYWSHYWYAVPCMLDTWSCYTGIPHSGTHSTPISYIEAYSSSSSWQSTCCSIVSHISIEALNIECGLSTCCVRHINAVISVEAIVSTWVVSV